jgi:hypothetical protein
MTTTTNRNTNANVTTNTNVNPNTSTTKTTTTTKNTTKNTSATFLSQGIGCETIGVPRNYIVGTLCRDSEAINAFAEPLFGNAGDSTVGVAKGLLFYTMMLEGEYAILRYLPANTRVSSSEIIDIPVDFLPVELRSAWNKVLVRDLPQGKTASVRDVVRMWQDFIIAALPADNATYGSGFVGATAPVKTNINRGLLLYTIYREGELTVHGGFTVPGSNVPQTITVGMGFLPKDLGERWQATISRLFTTNPSTTERDVMQAWREFVLHTVGDHAQRYVEQYATFYQAPELRTIPTGVMSHPSQGIRMTGVEPNRVRS